MSVAAPGPIGHANPCHEHRLMQAPQLVRPLPPKPLSAPRVASEPQQVVISAYGPQPVNVYLGKPLFPSDAHGPPNFAHAESQAWTSVGDIYPTKGCAGVYAREICRDFIFRRCLNGRRCPRTHCSKVSEQCQHFFQGRCKYGEYCRRIHPLSDEHPTPGAVAPEAICRHFLNATCTFGDHCSRVHPQRTGASPTNQQKEREEGEVILSSHHTSAPGRANAAHNDSHHDMNHSVPSAATRTTLTAPEPTVRLPKPATVGGLSADTASRASSPASSDVSATPSYAHLWDDQSENSWLDTGQSSDEADSFFSAHSQATSSTSSLALDVIQQLSPPTAATEMDASQTPETVHEGRRKGCNSDYHCAIMEPNIDTGAVPRPVCFEYGSGRTPSTEVCRDWLRGRCAKEIACKYRHAVVDEPSTQGTVTHYRSPHLNNASEKVDPPLQPRTNSRRIVLPFDPNPRLDDPDVELPSAGPTVDDVNTPVKDSRQTSMQVQSTAHNVEDFITVKLLPGFEVCEIVTGFESPIILVDNLPSSVPLKNLSRLLSTYGLVVDINRKARGTIFVRFSRAADATAASAALDGKDIFGTKAHVRMPIHKDDSKKLTVNDSTVRVDWELPSRVIYAGYDTLVQAEVAVASATQPIRGYQPSAEHHHGLPAVGTHTVKFVGLPRDVTADEMHALGSPVEYMWERPNYASSLEDAASGLERYLGQSSGLVRFALQPPPYRFGVITAWATYSSTAEAKAACAAFHRRMPACTGHTRISARQVYSVLYDVDMMVYDKKSYPLSKLGVLARSRGMEMGFYAKESRTGRYMQVRMKADSHQDVLDLKTELERILRGQVLRDYDRVMWHPFFVFPQGRMYIRDLERRLPYVGIVPDATRHELRVSGPLLQRREAFTALRVKIRVLTSQQFRIIPLSGDAIALYLDPDIIAVRARFGDGDVMLDMEKRALIIRGGETAYNETLMAVRRAKQRRQAPASHDPRACPVCFAEASSPVTLRCGHSWCRECMRGFLLSSAENKLFPLSCLGNGGQCTERINHHNARAVLSQNEHERLIHAAFVAYVNARPDEFLYCPTPDCRQVYRNASKGTALQCPACLIRICSRCHSEYHGGLRCSTDDGAAELEDWMKTHGAKRCPGCQVPIERDEGCYHVTCTQCHTHICWQCMETFPGGDGIYGHMQTEHGGWGLGPIEEY